VKRVLLLLPTTTYRTADFLDAVSGLDVEVVVGSERTPALAGLMEGRALRVDFRRPDAAALAIAGYARERPLDAIVPVDDEATLVAARAAAKRLADARAALRPSDISAVAEVALATAAVRHAQGREAEADAAFHEAIGLLAATEFSVNTGDFYLVYAEYLVAVGRHADARHALEEAGRRLGDRVKPKAQRIAELRQQLAARR